MTREVLSAASVAVFLLAFSLVCISCANEPTTAEEIVAGCAEAMGGMDKIAKLETLRAMSIYPDHGDHQLPFELKRPNKSRDANGQLIFDGKRACFVREVDGNVELEFIDQEELVDFDVQIGFYFPAFFEYASEFDGVENLDGKKHYKLKVDLPLGAEMTYWIDAETYLPARAAARFMLGGEERLPYRDLFDYKEVDGIYLPHGFTYPSRDGEERIEGTVVSYELNVPFEEGYFEIPSQQ